MDIVYPKCTEGHHMVEQMQKNPAAYLFHSLRGVYPEDFIWEMVTAIARQLSHR